jgi:hypothetical protein
MFRTLALSLLLLAFGTGCSDVRSMRRARDVDGLIGLLSDDNPLNRVKAIDALGYVGDSRAIRPLIKALGDDDPYVREHAARYLGCDYHSSLGCDTGEALQPLLDVLDDRDSFVRVEAVRSLGEHPLPAARAPLERLARSDPRWEVRQATAFALGRIGSTQSLPVLEAMLEDESEQVLRTVRGAIRRISSTRGANDEGDEERRLDVELEVEVRSHAEDQDAGAGDVAHGDAAP